MRKYPTIKKKEKRLWGGGGKRGGVPLCSIFSRDFVYTSSPQQGDQTSGRKHISQRILSYFYRSAKVLLL